MNHEERMLLIKFFAVMFALFGLLVWAIIAFTYPDEGRIVIEEQQIVTEEALP